MKPRGPRPTPEDLAPGFSGSTFNPERDGPRLTGQLYRVFALMRDGEWRTLAEISAAVQGSEAGVSARLRDLRKEPWGHIVERENVGGGLWRYRLLVRQRWGKGDQGRLFA